MLPGISRTIKLVDLRKCHLLSNATWKEFTPLNCAHYMVFTVRLSGIWLRAASLKAGLS
jgi:hypothetical protein